MNENEFLIIAQMWYERTHKLREIVESKVETQKRKDKAFKLFLDMAGRMQSITYGYSMIKLKQLKPINQ